MDLVAITDHDSIDGGLRAARAGRPTARDVILGEEVSCWLPVAGATGAAKRVEVHFGTWGMTETAHRELQPLRGNALEVAAYLRQAGIFFAFNHPFHFYQGQLPLERYLELLVDAAPAIETRNGAMLPAHNQLAAALARARGKVVVGGSDAHTLRRVGTTWTAAPGRDARGVPGQRRRGPRPRRRRPRRHAASSPPTSTASSRSTWLSLVGLRRHEIERAAARPRRQLLAGDAARRVRAADRRGPLEAARGALGRARRRRPLGARASAPRRGPPVEIEPEPGL